MHFPQPNLLQLRAFSSDCFTQTTYNSQVVFLIECTIKWPERVMKLRYWNQNNEPSHLIGLVEFFSVLALRAVSIGMTGSWFRCHTHILMFHQQFLEIVFGYNWATLTSGLYTFSVFFNWIWIKCSNFEPFDNIFGIAFVVLLDPNSATSGFQEFHVLKTNVNFFSGMVGDSPFLDVTFGPYLNLLTFVDIENTTYRSD